MFSLIAQQAKSTSSQRRLLMVATQQATTQGSLYPLQSQSFNSLFGGIFNKKKDEVQNATPAPQKSKQAAEPTKYHKESVATAEGGEEEDIKEKIRKIDRTGPNNLFGKYHRQRKTRQERNTQIEDHLHPDLLAIERVSIEKYENNKFKRGLDEGE